MKIHIKKSLIVFEIIFFTFMLPLGLTFEAFPEEIYKFERMWPTLQQPWYFTMPYDVAGDNSGFIYVTDTYKHRIQKFTSDGQFVVSWGKRGTGNGEFDFPWSIAIDSNDYVYVVDGENQRIQKFTSDGQFVAKWGDSGTGNGEFDLPHGIAVDRSGHLYIADTMNHRIQKFTSDGQFISKWGGYGTDNGKFNLPWGLVVDGNGYVYVADYGNHRIQKFTSTGAFVAKWGAWGAADGQLNGPIGIDVDSSGNLYVVELDNHRIQKFTSTGDFITRWGNWGTGNLEFHAPCGIVIDRRGLVYVADIYNNRIQKLTTDGQFVAKWGSGGIGVGEYNWPICVSIDSKGFIYIVDSYNNRIQKSTADGQFVLSWGDQGIGNSEFMYPLGLAVDSTDYTYVTDTLNHRIQKFTADGQFVTKWGNNGTGNGEFNWPSGIVVDSSGYVYVSDQENHRIQKFTADGQFVTKWGGYGTGDGKFNEPWGIAVDGSGYVYVVDNENCRIQKFTANGVFVKKWGNCGNGDGSFDDPFGITIGDNGYIYVADTGNHRIQKFSSNGIFVEKWGTQGTEPGMISFPASLALDKNGSVLICEGGNHRIQLFKKVTLDTNNKAIIVAGGGPYKGNYLWNATQMCANFAYRTLTYQGFTKESIYYLTSDVDLDLDNNNVLDDVDADATNSNLQHAITSWAADASSLVLYLVDHGGSGSFRMRGTETLSAYDLDSWLDFLQNTISGQVIFIYDACESGSYHSYLSPPSGKERIVITSTSVDESAYFMTQGSISFSNYFWAHIFNGFSIKEAFSSTNETIGFTTGFQNPLLDANSNGIGNEPQDFTRVQNTFIGNGTVVYGEAPVISMVSPHQTISGTNSANLFASGVTDNDGIARVWTVIRPPDYRLGSPDNPISELPTLDLMPKGSDGYEGTYGAFDLPGTYQIAIYAQDRIGNTSVPKLTMVSVENPLRRKAVIVAGAGKADAIWPAVEQNVKLCYEALSFQGYTDEAIYLLSPVSIPGVSKLPVLATLSNLEYALNTWAIHNTQDVVVYLIGNGDSGSFRINAAETLPAAVLDSWLDSIQHTNPGKVTLIYDACRSGSFLFSLKPPVDKERIVIASAGSSQPVCFLSEGDLSFSRYFWTRVANGTNVRDAFLHAKQAVEYTTARFGAGAVLALLDDNGNGLGNEKSDGQIARNYTIGVGIMLAGDDPLIGAISPQQTISAGGSAAIWAQDVTTTGSIDKVWAVIKPPGLPGGIASDPVSNLPIVELAAAGANRYEGSFSDFSSIGAYRVTVCAVDTEGAISMPKETTVCNGDCSDDYEDDDGFETANVIVNNAESAQLHNFHDWGDQDWVKFYGLSGQTYTISVQNAGSSCDAVIEVYDTNGANRIAHRDDNGAGEGEELAWGCPQDGIYFVMIRQFEPGDNGEDTEYELKVYNPIGPVTGFVTGVITDALCAQVIGEVQIKTNSNLTALSLPTGDYLLVHPPGTYSVTAQKSGYNIKEIAGVRIYEGGETPLNIFLEPIDTDNDGISDVVENAVTCLNANDDDSDDDGIIDGNEDADHDGLVDAGESGPCEEDSDGDGLLDGTEIGLTAPQGSKTDLGVFIADADPATTTDPLDNDTDNDGWLDGEEDQNLNGRVDAGEKDPNQFNAKALPHVPLLLFDNE